jgi:uncharacterized protein
VFVTVEELRLHPVSISETYPAGALDYHTADFRQTGNLKVRGVAELVGEEIRFHGHLETRVESACDRCLGLVQLPVQSDFDLTYRPMATIARKGEVVEVSDDELEVGFFSGGGIDVADVVAEQVNLFMPMQVTCTPECQGLCPSCGTNRNLEACGCGEAAHDSPFAVLADKLGG